jgi:hypothetical protein
MDDNTYRADQLPSCYIMNYHSDFSVVIKDDQILEICHGDESPYVFDSGLRIGLSPEQVFDCVGKPVDIVKGKNEYKKDVFYTDIGGNRGHGYYYLPDQRLRLWFSSNKLAAMYKTRSDWR